MAKNNRKKDRGFYDEIINNISEMIIYMDADFNIQWANQSVLEYFDIDLPKIRGQKCFIKWGQDFQCEGCPVIRARKTKQIEEKTMEKLDGKTWKMKVIPELNKKGEVEGFIEITLDVTEKREIEKVRNLLENLVNQTPGMTYQYRLFPDGSSVFPYTSGGIREIYEITPKEAKKMPARFFKEYILMIMIKWKIPFKNQLKI